MLKVTPEQMGRMHRVAAEFYVEELIDHARLTTPLALEFAGLENLRLSLRRVIRHAEELGLSTRGPVRLYADLALLFGTRVGDDPFHPWIREATDPAAGESEEVRGERLYQATLQYFAEVITPEEDRMARALQRLAQFDPGSAFASRRDVETRMPEVMNLLYPAKLRRALPNAAQQLGHLHAVIAESGPAQSAALSGWIACLKLFFGHHADRDPLYPWIETTLAETLAQGADARLALLRERTVVYARAMVRQLRAGKPEQEQNAVAA